MDWPRYSLRRFLLVASIVPLLGLSAHRYLESYAGRRATYHIWELDGDTTDIYSDVFIGPNCSMHPRTCHHGFWNDLLGYAHTRAILFQDSRRNAPIDYAWLRKLDVAIKDLPRLRAVFVAREDFTDEMIQRFSDKYGHIQFERVDDASPIRHSSPLKLP